nr:MAG TPA: hypothetical protein [Caudoviricetes sp.]
MAEKKKTVKMTVDAEKPYIGVNVRDENGEVLGIIPNGTKVELVGEFDETAERTEIQGVTKEKKKIKGTVLTKCLK